MQGLYVRIIETISISYINNYNYYIQGIKNEIHV